MRQRRRTWGIGTLLVLVAICISALGLLANHSRQRHRTVQERWDTTFGTRDEILARHPAQELNATAREITESTRSFGVASAPRSMSGFSPPDREVADRYRQSRGALRSWVTAQVALESTSNTPPPRAVQEFLSTFREPLDRLERTLIEGELAVWPSDLSRLFASPVPNLQSHIEINQVLIADSLAALHAGDRDRAARALEAAWRLGEAFDGNPELLVQLIRLSLIRVQAGALRHQPWLEHWIPRLDGRRYRIAVEQTLFAQGWMWAQYKWGPSDDELLDRLRSGITAPYMRLAAADTSERWRQMIVRLTELDYLCDRDLKPLGVDLTLPLPWWNRPGRFMIPGDGSKIERIVIGEIQLELTRKVVELEAQRRRLGRWPDATAAIEASVACPRDGWSYRVDGTTMRLEFDRPLAFPPTLPAVWAFSIDAAPQRKN